MIEPFSKLENAWLFFDTALMSACRVTAQ